MKANKWQFTYREGSNKVTGKNNKIKCIGTGRESDEEKRVGVYIGKRQ